MAMVAGAATASAQPAAPPPMLDIGVDQRVGARVPPDLRFTGADGASVRLGDYLGDGKPLLLILAYTRCPMLCSVVLDGVAEVLGRMDSEPGRSFRLLTVSIDPADQPHDAIRKQAVFLERIGYPGEPSRWPFLVGEEDDIRALAGSLGFRYEWDPRTRQYAHPAVVFVLGPDGTIARYLNGVRFEAAVVEAALRDAGQGRTSPSESSGSFLSCFRFESVLKQYWGRIQTLFRAGAVLIFAALVTAVVFLFRREQRKQS